MRLLNTCTFEMINFISDDSIPPYAVLSHTWGNEEVTYQDWMAVANNEVEQKQGYRKIKECCARATAEGLSWVWIDTCCIDKTSSAELGEAINSMFRWYENAEICLVHLTDVCGDGTQTETEEELRQSRWFTRGWTLQELLAPAELVFHSQDWQPLGTKFELQDLISEITGIETSYITGSDLKRASVSMRMSWAASRETSRAEDIAYCLLGIFDINMSLIYGEGEKAFNRLQHKIMKNYPKDHTLFAWGNLVDTPLGFVSDSAVIQGDEHIAWDRDTANERYFGLLAPSPSYFRNSATFVPARNVEAVYTSSSRSLALPVTRGAAVRIELPAIEGYFQSVYHFPDLPITQLRDASVIILLCHFNKNSTSYVGVPLRSWGYRSNARSELLLEIMRGGEGLFSILSLAKNLYIEPQRHIDLSDGDLVYSRFFQAGKSKGHCTIRDGVVHLSSDSHFKVSNTMNGSFVGEFSVCYTEDGIEWGFALILGRLPRDGLALGQLYAGIAPIYNDYRGPNTRVIGGRTWFVQHESFLVLDEEIEERHVMSQPSDKWELTSKPFPRISVAAERVPLQDGVSYIDVVNLVFDGDMDESWLKEKLK